MNIRDIYSSVSVISLVLVTDEASTVIFLGTKEFKKPEE
jgi:hypothetical protein